MIFITIKRMIIFTMISIQGSSRKHCSEVYRGTRAFSEPESRAIRDFIMARSISFFYCNAIINDHDMLLCHLLHIKIILTSRRKNIKMYITLHSYGQMILYPWGYDRSSSSSLSPFSFLLSALSSLLTLGTCRPSAASAQAGSSGGYQSRRKNASPTPTEKSPTLTVKKSYL